MDEINQLIEKTLEQAKTNTTAINGGNSELAKTIIKEDLREKLEFFAANATLEDWAELLASDIVNRSNSEN